MLFSTIIKEFFRNNKRLAAPLMGYPGIQYTQYTRDQAQLDPQAHYEVIMELNDHLRPDIVFPLMDLSREVHALGRKAVFHNLPVQDEITGDYVPQMIRELEKRDIMGSKRITDYLITLEQLRSSISSDQILCAYMSGTISLAGMIMGMDDLALSLLLDPVHVHELLSLCNNKLSELLPHLISAGAQAICFLEPTASLLSPIQAKEFSLDYISQLISAGFNNNVESILHICGNTNSIIDLMAETGAAVLSLDSPVMGIELSSIIAHLDSPPLLMGNINPSGIILNGTPNEVENEVNSLLASMRDIPGFILSTGCDLPQNTPISNIRALFSAVRT